MKLRITNVELGMAALKQIEVVIEKAFIFTTSPPSSGHEVASLGTVGTVK